MSLEPFPEQPDTGNMTFGDLAKENVEHRASSDSVTALCTVLQLPKQLVKQPLRKCGHAFLERFLAVARTDSDLKAVINRVKADVAQRIQHEQSEPLGQKSDGGFLYRVCSRLWQRNIEIGNLIVL